MLTGTKTSHLQTTSKMPEWTEDAPWPQADCTAIDSGTTAWLLTCMALVLFMTPGLAFFYGGLVPRTSVVTIMMQCIISMGLIAVVWLTLGFSLAFGESGGGFIGDPNSYFLLWNLDPCTPVGYPMHPGIGNFPGLLFAGYAMTFAIICPAIITGAFVDRVRFESYLIFIVLWVLAVYCPFAHWIWNPEGFLGKWGVKDEAGGLVVHVSAGFAALASVLVVGPRDFATEEEREAADTPHNRAFVALGTGMLWFGWLGNAGGSELAADGFAALAVVNTTTACSMAMICWVLVEWHHRGKPTLVGACVGAIAGLVAVAPCAGLVRPWAAMLLGLVAAGVCYCCRILCRTLRCDDALDVWAVHGGGGCAGTILLGVLADDDIGGQARGGELLVKQIVATVLCASYSLVVSFVILKAVDRLTPGGVRPSRSSALIGLDLFLHGEHAYTHDAVKLEPDASANANRGGDHDRNSNSNTALRNSSATEAGPSQAPSQQTQTVFVQGFASPQLPVFFQNDEIFAGMSRLPFRSAAGA